MRMFTTLVFDQLLYGTAEVPSPPEHNDLLGKAHDLVYEVEVDQAAGAQFTLMVRHKYSNSGKGFVVAATPVNAATIDPAALPFRVVVLTPGPFAASGQVTAQLSSSTASARVRIWVTGWSA